MKDFGLFTVMAVVMVMFAFAVKLAFIAAVVFVVVKILQATGVL
jgi:hypothetical protein